MNKRKFIKKRRFFGKHRFQCSKLNQSKSSSTSTSGTTFFSNLLFRVSRNIDYFNGITPHKIGKWIDVRLNNFHPPGINWVVASRFIESGVCTLEDIKTWQKQITDRELVITSLQKVRDNLSSKITYHVNSDYLSSACAVARDVVFPGLSDNCFKICYDVETIWGAIRKSSSSGLPNLKKKATLFNVVVETVHSFKTKALSMNVFSYQWLCSIVYQPSDKGYKGRVIYMPPMEITVLEIMLGNAIQEYLVQSKETVMKIGKMQIDLYDLMVSISSKHKVTGDFSSYDITVPSFLLLASSDILKSLVKMDEYEMKIWDIVFGYIFHGRVYHPCADGNIPHVRGIPSGSFFTNMLDGIANLIMNYYALASKALSLGEFKIYVCGDDNLIVSDSELDVDYHANMINSTFHTKVSYPLEYRHGPNSRCLGHFLGSLWYKHGPERVLGRMIRGAITQRERWPDKDELDLEGLLEGRVYTIFGYDSRLPYFWKKFKFKYPYAGRKAFIFNEGVSWINRPKEQNRSIGGWFDMVLEPWRTR